MKTSESKYKTGLKLKYYNNQLIISESINLTILLALIYIKFS